MHVPHNMYIIFAHLDSCQSFIMQWDFEGSSWGDELIETRGDIKFRGWWDYEVQRDLKEMRYTCAYCSVPGKCPWVLKHNSQFWTIWVLTCEQNLYTCRSCYIVAPWNTVHGCLLGTLWMYSQRMYQYDMGSSVQVKPKKPRHPRLLLTTCIGR